MPKLFASLFAALVMVVAAPPAEAQRVWPGHGAGGGVLSTVQCPEDKAMVGLTGAVGRYIDRLQIVCATLYADGTYGPPEPYGDPVGGGGGSAAQIVSCPRDAKMFDMIIVLDSVETRYLSHINIRCRGSVGIFQLYSFGRNQGTFEGDPGPGYIATQSCPQEHFVGLKIYFRDYVKAVGVICGNVDVTPVAVAPRPPPLHSTGKMPRPAPGPSVAPMIALAGGWETVTNQNGHFTVILQISNSHVNPLFEDLYVTGQMINSDGAADYNGTLQGVIPMGTRTLRYSYVQPKIEGSGTGQFTLSPDGNSITGSGKAGDVDFTWNGTRAK